MFKFDTSVCPPGCERCEVANREVKCTKCFDANSELKDGACFCEEGQAFDK